MNSNLVDSEGRSVISQLCMNFNMDTLSQIEYISKKTTVDYASLDGNGWSAMHHLANTNSLNVENKLFQRWHAKNIGATGDDIND